MECHLSHQPHHSITLQKHTLRLIATGNALATPDMMRTYAAAALLAGAVLPLGTSQGVMELTAALAHGHHAVADIDPKEPLDAIIWIHVRDAQDCTDGR